MELGNRGQGYGITPEEQARRNASMPNSSQYLGRCCGIWNIGTHDEAYLGVPKKSAKLILFFELYGIPLFVFDSAKGPQPWSAIIELTFSNDTKANLSKLIKSWHNNDPAVCAQVDSGKFRMDSLSGKPATLGIVKKATKKDPNVFRLDIATITAIMSGMEANMPAQPYNPLTLFDCDKFDLNNPQFMETFFAVPFWVQKKVCDSDEVKAKGITFDGIKKQFPARYADNRQQAPVQGMAPQPQPVGVATKTMTPKAAGATYDAFIASGWNDETMVREGYLIIAQPVPMQMALPMQAPPPMQMQTPQPVVQHQMTAKANGMAYEAFTKVGWTDDMLISQGYMVMGSGNPMPIPGMSNAFATGKQDDLPF
jgi:hypothetical protein